MGEVKAMDVNLRNYTTRIDAGKTAGEIVSLLVRHGAQQVTQDYNAGEIATISWVAHTAHGLVSFRLPVDVDKCYLVLKRQNLVRQSREGRDQARRVAWRIVKDWMSVQMALLQTEMVTLDQLMLPYALDQNGLTLYEHMLAGGFRTLTSGEAAPRLLEGALRGSDVLD